MRIYIQNRDQYVEIKPGFSLLNNFLMQRIPIQTVCGGKAICGRCRFKVLEGQKKLTRPREREIKRLGPEALAQGWRLACQNHAIGEITIYLPALDEELPLL